MEFVEGEGRRVLRARGSRVVEVGVLPYFFLRLSSGASLWFEGAVSRTVGPRGGDNPVEAIEALSSEELSGLVSMRPLSWVIFDNGNHRIVFSNGWHLALRVGDGGGWTLDMGDGAVLSFPSE
jgi:hypothetical protein